MFNKDEDGGAAFPTQLSEHDMLGGGLSIRDYFAAAALTGLAMRAVDAADACEHAALDAYAYADAMLKAREETPNG